MESTLYEWLSFGLRWLHVITGIAWIGSSFYFIALDLSLKKRDHLPVGVSGEAWQVHGGGFYNMRKYTIAPPELPPELTWFKWESYATWITGFFLLATVYYAAPELYLIDRNVMDLTAWQAAGFGIASMAVVWLIYDRLCKSPLVENTYLLLAVVFAMLAFVGWALTQVYSGRGAFIHLGAITATIMTANVAHTIIPNQRRAVEMLKRGETPPAEYGKQAKQRSLHNNYLTLPVIFLMLSNHYPLSFATEYNWVIAILVMVMGGVIRHWFNEHHAGRPAPNWCWAAAAICFVGIMWLSEAGPTRHGEADQQTTSALLASPHYDAVEEIVLSRCSMCHAAEPVWDGVAIAPKDIRLETPDEIVRYASLIYDQAARS
ncbi:MAG: urate hydroxylase PuuD, partial [Rhodobacteraceae bacterium]|nr:urate hydroxylase PuuD [Paracoccaceae bacterium]